MKFWGGKREAAKLDSASMISKTKDAEALEKFNDEQNHILLCWNVSAIAAVSVPLFGYLVEHVIDAVEGKEYYYGGSNVNKGVTVALDFVYVWGLILFITITVWGNRVLRDHNNKNLRTLIGGLFVFTNLTLLCAILSAGLAIASNAPLRDVFFEKFSSVIILSFSFWTVFGVVFTLVLFRQKMRSKVMFSSDYLRYENDIVA